MSKPINKDVNVTTTTNLLSLTYSLSADMSKPIAVIKNMFKHINLGDHEDNDDVPLLFSPISESHTSLVSQELEPLDHCHGQEPRRDSSTKARRPLQWARLNVSSFKKTLASIF